MSKRAAARPPLYRFPFSLPVCLALWQTIWVPALRAAGHDFPLDSSIRALPCWPILRVLGPLWLLRQVAAALASGLAWQRQMHWHLFKCYPEAYEISWQAIAQDGIEVETREEMSEEFLRWLIGLQLAFFLLLLDDSFPPTQE